MKNFFKTGLYVSAFAIAGIFFQVACSNESESRSSAALNKILYSKYDSTVGYTIWYCDIDGANPTQIPLNLPSTVHYMNSNANIYTKFSPDGQQVFFVANDSSSGVNGEDKIYSCNLDGSNLQAVVSPSSEIVILSDIR